jgi:hypothetical protein
MVKFITRVSVFLVLSVLLAGFILYLSITFCPAYFLGAPMDYYICTFQYDRINTSNYRNIIIGDSRGNASIDPKDLGNSWINLSIPGSDLFEGYYTLKHYLQRNKLDTVIMIYGSDYLEGGSPYFFQRTVPFRFVTPNELHDLDLLERRIGFAFHDTSITGRKGLFLHAFYRKLKYDHFPLSYRGTFIDGLTTLVQSGALIEARSREIAGLLKKDLGHLSFGLADSNNTVFFGDRNRSFKPDRINLAFLDSTMALAAKNNMVTYFILAPMNRASWLTFKNSILESTRNAFLNELATKYPRVHLIKGPVFLDNSYFGDALHLNSKGTLLYSANLRRLLSNGLSQ